MSLVDGNEMATADHLRCEGIEEKSRVRPQASNCDNVPSGL